MRVIGTIAEVRPDCGEALSVNEGGNYFTFRCELVSGHAGLHKCALIFETNGHERDAVVTW